MYWSRGWIGFHSNPYNAVPSMEPIPLLGKHTLNFHIILGLILFAGRSMWDQIIFVGDFRVLVGRSMWDRVILVGDFRVLVGELTWALLWTVTA
jgi:hypothetical protein